MDVALHRKVDLEEPDLIAAWPGMGMLAVLVADHLRLKLKCKLFAEMYSWVNSVSFVDGVLESTRVRHRFYYSNRLVVCVGESQPLTAGEVYGLAEDILKFMSQYGVKRVYTSAASLSTFSGEPKVYGIVNDDRLLDFLDRYKVPLVKGEGKITGLNGVLLGVARRREVEGICLLGQIKYMDIPQPRSASVVVGVLSRMLGIEVGVGELEEQAKRIDESIQETLKRQKIVKPGKKGLDYIG